MSRDVPDFIAEATEQFMDRCGLTTIQRDALMVIVKAAFESGFDRGRIEGAEAIVALATPNVTTGGAA